MRNGISRVRERRDVEVFFLVCPWLTDVLTLSTSFRFFSKLTRYQEAKAEHIEVLEVTWRSGPCPSLIWYTRWSTTSLSLECQTTVCLCCCLIQDGLESFEPGCALGQNCGIWHVLIHSRVEHLQVGFGARSRRAPTRSHQKRARIMHTVWVRLNAVVFFGLTVLLGLSILAAVSKSNHAKWHKPGERASRRGSFFPCLPLAHRCLNTLHLLSLLLKTYKISRS